MATQIESSNDPTPEIPKRRFFSRSSGRVATEATVEQVLINEISSGDEIESNPIPFNLERQLINYQQLWETHQSCIEDSLSDIELREDVNKVLNVCLANLTSPTRETKTGIARLTNTGYDKIVKVSFAVGRLHSTRSDRIILDTNEGIVKTIGGLLPQAIEYEKVRKRLVHLFDPSNLPFAPLLIPKVHSRLVDIFDVARETYKPIYKIEEDISISIMKQLQKNPDLATQLLDSFLQCSDSEVEIEKTFARFLANSYELDGDISELSQALRLIEQSEATNTFTADFLKTQLAENNGDNLIAFFAAKKWNSETEFLKFMTGTFSDWPEDYRETYRSYISDKFRTYSLNVHKQVQLAKHKAWMMTDLASVEEDVDRLWYTIYPSQIKSTIKAKSNRQNGRAVPRNKLSIEDIVPDIRAGSHEQLPLRQIMAVKRDVTNNQFISQDVESIEEIITRYLGHDAQAKRLAPIYAQAIALLKETPFPNKGVASTAKAAQSAHILIDGRRTKVYRANPVQLPGIKAPAELQRGRIIYAVEKDNLIIVNMFATHDDYDTFLKTL